MDVEASCFDSEDIVSSCGLKLVSPASPAFVEGGGSFVRTGIDDASCVGGVEPENSIDDAPSTGTRIGTGDDATPGCGWRCLHFRIMSSMFSSKWSERRRKTVLPMRTKKDLLPGT